MLYKKCFGSLQKFKSLCFMVEKHFTHQQKLGTINEWLSLTVECDCFIALLFDVLGGLLVALWDDFSVQNFIFSILTITTRIACKRYCRPNNLISMLVISSLFWKFVCLVFCFCFCVVVVVVVFSISFFCSFFSC